jgi:hypothetical protein
MKESLFNCLKSNKDVLDGDAIEIKVVTLLLGMISEDPERARPCRRARLVRASEGRIEGQIGLTLRYNEHLTLRFTL